MKQPKAPDKLDVTINQKIEHVFRQEPTPPPYTAEFRFWTDTGMRLWKIPATGSQNVPVAELLGGSELRSIEVNFQ